MTDPTMPIMAIAGNSEVCGKGFVCGSTKPCKGELTVNGTTLTETGPSPTKVMDKLETTLRSLLKRKDVTIMVDMDQMTTD